MHKGSGKEPLQGCPLRPLQGSLAKPMQGSLLDPTRGFAGECTHGSPRSLTRGLGGKVMSYAKARATWASDYVYDSLYLQGIITFHYNTSQIDDNDRPAQCPAGAQVCAEGVSLTSMHDGYN